jgi:hypothetical protein
MTKLRENDLAVVGRFMLFVSNLEFELIKTPRRPDFLCSAISPPQNILEREKFLPERDTPTIRDIEVNAIFIKKLRAHAPVSEGKTP